MPGLFVIPQLVACLSEAGRSFPLTTLWPSEGFAGPRAKSPGPSFPEAGGPPHRIISFPAHAFAVSGETTSCCSSGSSRSRSWLGSEVSAVCYSPPEQDAPLITGAPTLAARTGVSIDLAGGGSRKAAVGLGAGCGTGPALRVPAWPHSAWEAFLADRSNPFSQKGSRASRLRHLGGSDFSVLGNHLGFIPFGRWFPEKETRPFFFFLSGNADAVIVKSMDCSLILLSR